VYVLLYMNFIYTSNEYVKSYRVWRP